MLQYVTLFKWQVFVLPILVLFVLKGEKMKDKNNYQSPEIELMKINVADVIATSGLNDIKPDLGENDGEWL